jgi:UDP-N-acetylglucosamine--N-acetylmuramyl-(pentapeptide) pyrophosphoryl-undecaprenol N-acetylglucosamine transferase
MNAPFALKRHQSPFKIYFSVSSEGYGHSSRAMALTRTLEPHEYLIGTYGIALDRVQALGYSHVAIPQELKLMGNDGGFDVGATILNTQSAVLNFNQLVQQEMDIIRDYGATLVVADGRIAPVVAAARMDVPCLVLTNQSAFYPFFEKDTPLVKLLGISFEWVMKFWLCSAEEILIPDFPPPYTVCLPNLSFKPKVKKRTRFLGPLVTFDVDHVVPVYFPEAQGKPIIVVSLGGHSYRRPLLDCVIDVAPHFPEFHFVVLTRFAPATIPANVTIHGHVKECAGYFKAAHLVITQAGHSTAMELMSLGKPCLVVPDYRQTEQEQNAQRLVDLGMGLKLDYPTLSSVTLTETLNQLLLQLDWFTAHARQYAMYARELNGSGYGASVLHHYAQRLRAY